LPRRLLDNAREIWFFTRVCGVYEYYNRVAVE
jgi:hypothetical protein